MKPFEKLTEAEKHKLEKVGMLWELYPEGSSIIKLWEESTAEESSDEPDNPEMVQFLSDVEFCAPRQWIDDDIKKIALAWEINMNNKRVKNKISAVFDKIFGED